MKDLESPASGGGLVWQDIKVTVPVKRSLFRKTPADAPHEKVLLEGLSGSVAPGEMLAALSV